MIALSRRASLRRRPLSAGVLHTVPALIAISLILSHRDHWAFLAVAVAGGYAVAFAFLARRWTVIDRRSPYLPPSNLPPPPTHVVGRESELEGLRDHLLDQDNGRRMAAVVGTSGIGKTALAVLAAHRAAPKFSAGELFAHFDADMKPRQAARAVRVSLIAALNRQGEPVPRSAIGQLVRYWRLTSRLRPDNQLLMVLDDVTAARQIRLLVPRSRWCAVIITSKADLRGLRATYRLDLDRLSEPAAERMLGAIIGYERQEREEDIARDMVAAAACHPLGIRLVGMALANRPHVRLSVALDRMAQHRLASPAGQPFATSLDLSYSLLTQSEQRAVSVLGLIERRRFAAWELAELLRSDERTAWLLCDRLTEAGLLERRSADAAGVQYFQMLEHVESYARLRVRQDLKLGERQAAMKRLKLKRDSRSSSGARPGAVFEKLYETYETGRISLTFKDTRDQVALARERRDGVAEADATVMLAELQAELGGFDDVVDLVEMPLESSSDPARARGWRLRAKLHRRARQVDDARRALDDALHLCRSRQDVMEQIRVLREYAAVESLGDHPWAGYAYIDEARRLAADRPDQEAGTAYAHSRVLLAEQRYLEAEAVLVTGQEAARRDGKALWNGWITYQRALVALRADRTDDALQLAKAGADVFGNMRHRYGTAHCRAIMGHAMAERGNRTMAAMFLEEALETFRYCGDAFVEAEAAESLAEVRSASGELRDAKQLYQNAERLFDSIFAGRRREQARAQWHEIAHRLAKKAEKLAKRAHGREELRLLDEAITLYEEMGHQESADRVRQRRARAESGVAR